MDGHLCSYYHTIDKSAFLAMRNNVRFLKKFYVPMAALCGYGSYLRPGEVLNPRQIRQFALAAFVNGCPGYAFYSGVCYDGEVLLKMMEAQDEIVRYEGLKKPETIDLHGDVTGASAWRKGRKGREKDWEEVKHRNPSRRRTRNSCANVHAMRSRRPCQPSTDPRPKKRAKFSLAFEGRMWYLTRCSNQKET